MAHNELGDGGWDWVSSEMTKASKLKGDARHRDTSVSVSVSGSHADLLLQPLHKPLHLVR